jgi:tetratricopeptide (TPR) repeat protein
MIQRASLTPRVYLLAEAGLLLTLAYLLILAGSSNGIVNYDLTRFSLGVLTALACLWLAATAWRMKAGASPVMPLAAPATLFMAAYLLAALISIDPRRSLGDAWLMGGYLCVFALTANLVRWGWPRELFTKVLLIIGGVLLGLGWYSIWQWYAAWLAAAPGQWIPSSLYRLPASNTLAVFWNVLLMVAIARWGPTQSRLSRVWLGLWIVAALGLIYFSSSRGGWVGTAAGLAAMAGFKLIRRGSLARLGELKTAVLRRPILAVTLGCLGVLGAVGIGRLAYVQWNHPTHAIGLASRDYLWMPALKAFLASPWVGQGPFTFGSLYMRVNSVPPSPLYIHAHSVPLSFMAETGLVGTLALAVLALAVCRRLWHQLNQLQGHDQAVVIGAGAALAALAGHGLFESVNFEPSNSLLIAILFGVALASPEAEKTQAGAPRGRGWPVLGAAVVLIAVGWYGIWLSTPLHRGVEKANETRWAEAAVDFEEAARRDSRSAVVYQQLGLANSILASEGDTEALGQAIEAFEMAARLDPDWPLNHANLGALYQARGDRTAALEQFREAAQRAPGAALYFLNLGQMAEESGYAEEARQAYAAALQLGSEPAYFWRSTAVRSTAWETWRSTRASAQNTSAESVGEQVHAYTQSGEVEAATTLLQKATLAGSLPAYELSWANAELAAGRNDFQAATVQGEAAVRRYLAQSVYGPGTFGDRSYGPYLFRREAMALDLAPQLTPLPLPDVWAVRMVRLGDWYAASGDKARSIEIYQEVLRDVPDNVGALNRLKVHSCIR